MKNKPKVISLFYVENDRRKVFSVYEQLENKAGRKLFEIKYRTANSNVPYELTKEEAEEKVDTICSLLTKRYTIKNG